jgi:hypothetical protein
MPSAIPLPANLVQTGFFDVQATLDGATYTLQFGWNNRLSCWFMQVRNEEDTDLLCGDARVVVNWPLYLYLTGRQPPGLFYFYDTTGQDQDIVNAEDLGQRVQMQYWSEAELAAG